MSEFLLFVIALELALHLRNQWRINTNIVKWAREWARRTKEKD